MVTCQLSELSWEVTVELPADFLSLGRVSVITAFPVKVRLVTQRVLFSIIEDLGPYNAIMGWA